MVLPIAILNIIIAYFLLKNVTKRTFPELDKLSILLSTLGFGGILYGFSTAGNAGWISYQVIGSLVIGGVMLAWFIIRQMHLKSPILEFRVFKYQIFTVTTVLGMVTFMTMIGAAVILPLYMQQMLGFNAFHSGLALLGGAIIQGIMNPITGRLFDRYGARYLAMIGLVLIVDHIYAEYIDARNKFCLYCNNPCIKNAWGGHGDDACNNSRIKCIARKIYFSWYSSK